MLMICRLGHFRPCVIALGRDVDQAISDVLKIAPGCSICFSGTSAAVSFLPTAIRIMTCPNTAGAVWIVSGSHISEHRRDN